MVLDLFIGIPVIVAVLLGFRDGLVRKLVAIVMILLGMYIAQITRQDVGEMLLETGIASPENAPIRAFLIVFFGICVIQSFLYRLLTNNYKLGGFADKVAGAALGFVQGILFMSVILMALAPTGFPSRYFTRDSQFYKSVVNVAPQLLDCVNLLSEEAKASIQKLEEEISLEEQTSSKPKKTTSKKLNSDTK